MKSEFEIVVKPLITEKSNVELAQNKYTFKVARGANKIEIKSAIEKLYSVKVKDINTLNFSGKI